MLFHLYNQPHPLIVNLSGGGSWRHVLLMPFNSVIGFLQWKISLKLCSSSGGSACLGTSSVMLLLGTAAIAMTASCHLVLGWFAAAAEPGPEKHNDYSHQLCLFRLDCPLVLKLLVACGKTWAYNQKLDKNQESELEVQFSVDLPLLMLPWAFMCLSASWKWNEREKEKEMWSLHMEK